MMFLRSFSHELRHPIVSITGISNLTLKNLDQNSFNQNQINQINKTQHEKIQHNLKLIEQESKQLLNISNQIIDITDIQSNDFQLQKTDFQVADLINECFDSIRASAERKKITLVTEISKTLPKIIIADKQRIQMVLMILLHNALKYTKAGFIQIQACLNEMSLSRPRTYSNDASISYNDSVFLCKFKVKDSGIGIQDKINENLFSLFGKIKEQENSLERPAGIGLGLYTAQLLAVKLGNKPIIVESLSGKGSSFTFYSFYHVKERICHSDDDIILLQDTLYQRQSSDKAITYQNYSTDKNNQSYKIAQHLRRSEKAYSKTSTSQIQLPCNCTQILLVDDTVIIIQILSEVLNQYTIEEASDGLEALNIVSQKTQSQCCQVFQLIIMDCQMPIMDGCDATRRIRALGYDAPILGYTAYNNNSDIQMCLESGMDKVLNKPAKAAEMLQVVEILKNTYTKREPSQFKCNQLQSTFSLIEYSDDSIFRRQSNTLSIDSPLFPPLKEQFQDQCFKKYTEKLCKDF